MIMLSQLMIIMTGLLTLGSGSGIRVDISPREINQLIPKYNITVTCQVTNKLPSSTEILVMEIGKDGERSIASLRPRSNFSFGSAKKTKFYIEGQLDENSSQSCVRLIIVNPSKNDAGTYKCLIVHLDKNGDLKVESTKSNLTIVNHDAGEIIDYFMNRISVFEDRIKTAEDVIRKQEETIKGLKNHSNTQDAKLRRQERKLNAHNTKLNDHNSHMSLDDLTLNRLNYTVNNIQNEIGEYENRFKSHGNQFHKESILVKEYSDTIKFVEDSLRNHSKLITKLNDREDSLVVFSAAYDNKNTFKLGDTVIFSHVLVQEGNGYDANTGIFKAPKPGFYVFHLTIMSTGPGVYHIVDIQVNAKPQARVFASDSDRWAEQSSTSCIVKLEVGDIVKAVIANTTPVHGTTFHNDPYYSMFTGYMIKRLW